MDGSVVGFKVGSLEGIHVGISVGDQLGEHVGIIDGLGVSVGWLFGENDGKAVGAVGR
jgi:hypothetical protein